MKLKGTIAGAVLITLVALGSFFTTDSEKPVIEEEYFGKGKRDVLVSLEEMENKAAL